MARVEWPLGMGPLVCPSLLACHSNRHPHLYPRRGGTSSDSFLPLSASTPGLPSLQTPLRRPQTPPHVQPHLWPTPSFPPQKGLPTLPAPSLSPTTLQKPLPLPLKSQTGPVLSSPSFVLSPLAFSFQVHPLCR